MKKEFIGLETHRKEFLKSLNSKGWKIEYENVLQILENQVDLQTLWRLVVLEWNNWKFEHSVKYFISLNPSNSKERESWYHLLLHSSIKGNILFINQLMKDLLSKDQDLLVAGLKYSSCPEENMETIFSKIEKLTRNKSVIVRKNAFLAYFSFLRLDKTLSNQSSEINILRGLTDKDPQVMAVALLGVKEFLGHKDLQDPLIHILKQSRKLEKFAFQGISAPFLQIRILSILEK